MSGLNIDPLNPKGNPPGAELATLGVRVARFSYIDRTPGPALDPAALDFYTQKVIELRVERVSSLLILTYDTLPNAPGFNASGQEWESYISHFTQRVAQIAAKFGPYGVSLQIWNEPDLPPAPGYEPSLRPEVYASMLDKACKVILTGSQPQITIVGAGLASGDPSWWSEVYAKTIQPLDVLAIHPYGQRPAPDWPAPDWGFGFVGDLIDRYRAVWGGQIWITEAGESTTNQAEQAEYLRKFYGTIKESYDPPVDQVFWFCYGDGMVPPYGLRDEAGIEKEAYQAYRGIADGQ